MRRLLIVSPHFPPTNAADMQRVRMVLPFLVEAGWECEVLSVHPQQVAAPCDPWLEQGLPASTRVHRVRALGLGWGRIPGLGSLVFRALPAVRASGDRILGQRKFDLVYFSTTQFGMHCLGPRWRRKFAAPFVMDYQDPWVNDYYRLNPQITPPGGRLKYFLADRFNRWMEPRVLRCCHGITTVTQDYWQQLRDRYPFLTDSWPVAVLPFPGDETDLRRVEEEGIRQQVFQPHDGHAHWVYVGRGGPDMTKAARSIFLALAHHCRTNPKPAERIRLHFIGTSYAGAGKGVKTIEPLAESYGLKGKIAEHPDRIPYSQTLRCLLDADALIVPGSEDPAYTASKIYPYLLAGKPLLAVFHENSSVVDLLRNVGGGIVVPFRTADTPENIAGRITKEWFDSGASATGVSLDAEAFDPFTARVQANKLSEFFDGCLATSRMTPTKRVEEATC
jgi:hypothetical protein